MKKILFVCLFVSLLFGCSNDLEKPAATGTLYGHVADGETGDPIANANIRLYSGIAADCSGEVLATAVTGTDGYFQMSEVDPGKSYEGRFILVSHPHYRNFSQRVSIQANHNTELQILLYAQ